MSLNFRAYSDFLVIVGHKAFGKTTLTKHYCKTLQKIIAIDPTWQLGELGYVVHYPERLLPAALKYHKVVYQPKKMGKEHYKTAFQTCLQLSNYTLPIDELNKFARPRWYLTPEIEEIVNRGRAQGIGIIGNTRRPHLIHNDIRSNADHVICFKLHEEADIEYMGKWLNISPEQIKKLPRYYSYYYNVHEQTVTLQKPLY